MAEVAVEINNRLLEVIRPLFARLCALGVLQNRDMQTVRFLLFFFPVNFFGNTGYCVKLSCQT